MENPQPEFGVRTRWKHHIAEPEAAIEEPSALRAERRIFQQLKARLHRKGLRMNLHGYRRATGVRTCSSVTWDDDVTVRMLTYLSTYPMTKSDDCIMTPVALPVC